MSLKSEHKQLDWMQSIALTGGEAVVDMRNIKTGTEIPAEFYADQPYVVKTNDGNWLCITTTSAGHEGTSGQHVISVRSYDKGKTWTDKRDVEPACGIESSYAVMQKTPLGRVYAFYNHNTDDVRRVKADNPPYADGYCYRVDSLGHFVFKYTDDHGLTWSEKRYDIPIREFEIDRKNADGGKLQYFWNVGKPFVIGDAVFVPVHKVGGFGTGFFTSTEGVLLRSDNLLTENNPEKITFETLPDGDVGIRNVEGGGPICEEHSFVVLSDKSIFVLFRTVDGHSGYSYSRDGGKTFAPSKYMTYEDGREFKHPRAATFVWKCENGKYLIWYHNHAGRDYVGRNPVWMSCGIEVDTQNGKEIAWSQPEIILYEDDVLVRMSYPDFVEDEGVFYITETQKNIARCHIADQKIIHALFSQKSIQTRTDDGLLSVSGGDTIETPALAPFVIADTKTADLRAKNMHGGFSIELVVDKSNLSAGDILFSSMTPGCKGIEVVAEKDGAISLAFGDGETMAYFKTETKVISAQINHLVLIVDGGPKVIAVVANGLLIDGGAEKQTGFGRFSPYLKSVNGYTTATLCKSVRSASFYKRALLITEAIGNYRAQKI